MNGFCYNGSSFSKFSRATIGDFFIRKPVKSFTNPDLCCIRRLFVMPSPSIADSMLSVRRVYSCNTLNSDLYSFADSESISCRLSTSFSTTLLPFMNSLSVNDVTKFYVAKNKFLQHFNKRQQRNIYGLSQEQVCFLHRHQLSQGACGHRATFFFAKQRSNSTNYSTGIIHHSANRFVSDNNVSPTEKRVMVKGMNGRPRDSLNGSHDWRRRGAASLSSLKYVMSGWKERLYETGNTEKSPLVHSLTYGNISLLQRHRLPSYTSALRLPCINRSHGFEFRTHDDTSDNTAEKNIDGSTAYKNASRSNNICCDEQPFFNNEYRS